MTSFTGLFWYTKTMNFLEELEQLRYRTPRLYNINIGSQNSDYCTHSDKNKNCYLLFAANFNEDCMYGGCFISSRDCVDCDYCDKSELCYDCVDLDHCYNCTASQDIRNCTDCSFCYDCVGCQNCFGCAGLRQKQYHLYNKPVGKEAYIKSLQGFDYKNPARREEERTNLEAIKLQIPHLASRITQSENCVGEYIGKSKNCFSCFDTHECEDCFYLKDAWHTKDSAELTFSDITELCYECFSLGLNCYNCNFSNFIRGSSDCEYCELCFSCKHCFGCVGLQSKEFYILNKPYSRDEYFKKVAEIKQEMRSLGIYGKQLPTTYKYEDTAAVYLR